MPIYISKEMIENLPPVSKINYGRYGICYKLNSNTVLKIFKYFYPLPGLLMTSYILYVGDISIWTFVDITSGIPTFVNVLVLLVLSKQYFVLLKDYKARYLGVGKVDKNTKLFYEDIKGEKNDAYLL